MTMFLFMIAVGGCGGGGGGNGGGAVLPQLPSHSLSSLQLSLGALSPAFNPTTTNYSVSVANSVTSITVTPRITSANTTILVNGINVASGNAHAVNLDVGQNTIEIIVENTDGSTTYTVIVTRESTGTPQTPELSSLQLSSGAISPDFSPTTTQYIVDVANTVASVTFTPTTDSANAFISVNGVLVTSGSTSGAINLNVGANIISIVVGNNSGSTTYTITVTRDSQPSGPEYRRITAAQAQTMMSQSSGFILLDVRTESEFWEIRIDGATLIPHDQVENRALAELPNKDQIIFVYCKAGVRSEYAARALVQLGYTNVYDFGGIDDWPYETISSPRLSDLQLSSGVLSPVFNPTTTLYTVSVANSASSITVTPTTASANTTISVNGANVPSGSASGAINLNVGSNTIAIVLANASGSTTYMVTVTRLAGSLPPMLSALQLSSSSLSPAFSPATTRYTVSVANTVSSITITPTTTSSNASITVNGANVPNGSASGAITLSVGANTITIIVGNSDGSTTYTVTATRAEAGGFGYWIDFAEISWWNAANTNFTITTPQQLVGIARLIVDGTTNFSGQTITLANNISLAGNEWEPITGSYGSGYFSGVFDGGGNTISGLSLYSSATAIGLFGVLGTAGTIKNLVLNNASVTVCPT